MPFLSNTPAEQREMLASIGVDSIEALFETIPAGLRLQRPLQTPPAMSELELTQHLTRLADANLAAGRRACFLGAGSYDHFVPAVVDTLAARGEFYTSYTPYQPEVSQGNLQVMFEYQSLICELTGMDVSNASLYDGGSAAVEAALLCMSVTKRTAKVVASATVHPEYLQILETYFQGIGAQLVVVPAAADGATDLAALAEAVDDQTACVLLQQPNFFGVIESVAEAAEAAHAAGALLALSFDPISLGLLARPGDQGADVAVAEGQSLGTPMLYGGPYLGIMACREAFLRRLPGRIAGQTVDRHGRRCFVLTRQAREQHISRERATSNICTNQGLFALRAAIYLSLQGPQGLRETAELCLHKARYAARELAATERFELPLAGPTFKEFVVRDRLGRVPELLAHAAANDILAGVPLAPLLPDQPELHDCFLVAVTEKRTREEIDALVRCLVGAEQETALHA